MSCVNYFGTQPCSRARRTRIDPHAQTGVLNTGSNHGTPVVRASAHYTPRNATIPTPPLTMHYSPLSSLLVQIWTRRTMFARLYQRALLNFRTSNAKLLSTMLVFDPPRFQTPYSRSGINVDGADIKHRDIARDIEQVRSRSFVPRRSCRHSSLVPLFLIPISVTCHSLDIVLATARN